MNIDGRVQTRIQKKKICKNIFVISLYYYEVTINTTI